MDCPLRNPGTDARVQNNCVQYGQVWTEKDLEEKEEPHGKIQEACKMLSGLPADDVHLEMRFPKKAHSKR